MEDRKGLSHDETVMAYGEVLAPEFFHKIATHLPQLGCKLPETPVSLAEIAPWLRKAKNLENLSHENIGHALYNIQRAPSDLTMTTGLKPQEVWKLTYHLVRTIYEKNAADEGAQNLLQMYGMKPEEQNFRCHTRGIDRNFQVLTQGYKLLIERY